MVPGTSAGVAEGEKEDLEGWRGFLRHLKDRSVNGVRLIISDACRGSAETAGEIFPNADWRRWVVHRYRNVFSHVSNTKIREVARMLKSIHAKEDRKAADAKSKDRGSAQAMKLPRAADWARRKETPTYFAYPYTQWRQIRTNPLEWIIREIRHELASAAPSRDGKSAVAEVERDVAGRRAHHDGVLFGR